MENGNVFTGDFFDPKNAVFGVKKVACFFFRWSGAQTCVEVPQFCPCFTQWVQLQDEQVLSCHESESMIWLKWLSCCLA